MESRAPRVESPASTYPDAERPLREACLRSWVTHWQVARGGMKCIGWNIAAPGALLCPDEILFLLIKVGRLIGTRGRNYGFIKKFRSGNIGVDDG